MTSEEHPEAAAPPPVPVPVPEKVVEHPSPLTGIARGGIAVGIAIIIVGREFLENGADFGGVPILGLIALGIAVIAGLSGIVTWKTTTFIADDDEFRVERNFLSKTSTRVDYTKVQSIDISQPFIARVLGLAKVHIDVGGAGGVDLEFLTKARAESLREHLLEHMQRARIVSGVAPSAVEGDASLGDGPPVQATTDGATVPSVRPESEEVVVKVPPRNLILGSLVSTGAIGALLAAAFFVVVTILSGSPVTLIASAIAVVGWIWAQTGANWGFVMTRRGDTLRLSRGLLSTSAQGLRPGRIQAVAIQQDLLQRTTGLYRMSVTVLGYGNPLTDEDKATNAIVLPYGTWDDVLRVLHVIWPGLDLAAIEVHGQPDRARWLTPLTFSTHTWGIGDEVVIAQHGLINQVRSIVPHRRMQSASIEQGPLQRRLDLAQIYVHTTNGPVTLRMYNLDATLARSVFEDQLARAKRARESAD